MKKMDTHDDEKGRYFDIYKDDLIQRRNEAEEIGEEAHNHHDEYNPTLDRITLILNEAEQIWEDAHNRYDIDLILEHKEEKDFTPADWRCWVYNLQTKLHKADKEIQRLKEKNNPERRLNNE